MKKSLRLRCFLLLLIVWLPIIGNAAIGISDEISLLSDIYEFAPHEEASAPPHAFIDILYAMPGHFAVNDQMVDDQPTRFYADPDGPGLQITFSATPLAERLTNGRKTSLALIQKIVENAVSGDGLVPLQEPVVFEINRRIAARFRYALETEDGYVLEDSMVLLHGGYLYTITCRAEAGQEEALEAFSDQLFATVFPVHGHQHEEGD